MGGRANGVGLNTLGTSPTPQQYYDFINSGGFKSYTDSQGNHLGGMSDSSKTAFNNYLLTYQTNMMNKQLADEANQHEIDMWHLNNEYNTPEKQMQRMIAAGINPAAAYGQIDAGNASSAPGTHMSEAKVPGSTNFHDTSDKLQMVNTVLNGINTLFSSANQIIDGASDVQNIALRHQNNWYDKLRADYFNNGGSNFAWLTSDKNSLSNPYEVAPGLYMDATAAQLLPELRQGFNTQSALYHFAHNQDARAEGLYNKQVRIDSLMQKIFKDIDSSSYKDLFRDFLELFSYQLLNRN